MVISKRLGLNDVGSPIQVGGNDWDEYYDFHNGVNLAGKSADIQTPLTLGNATVSIAALDLIGNVDVPSPSNNQQLIFETASNEWKAKNHPRFAALLGHWYVYIDQEDTNKYKASNGLVTFESETDVSIVLDSIALAMVGGIPLIIDFEAGDFVMLHTFNELTSDKLGFITIKGKGMGVTNLIASSSILSGTVFDIFGSVTGSQTSIVTGNTESSVTMEVADGSTFAAGDYFLVRSADDFSTAASKQGKKGEIRRVVDKPSANVITLDKWLQDTYTTTPNIIKVAMLQKVTLEDFTIKAGIDYVGTGTFLQVAYADNVRINRVEVQDHLGSGVWITSCLNPIVDVVCTQTPGSTFNDQYGVVTRCATENAEIHIVGSGRYRHLYTCDATGTANFEGQNRGITISGLGPICDEATWDTHATGIGFLFKNCSVMGTRNNAAGGDAKGFQMRAKRCTIEDCKVYYAIGKGITLDEDASGSIVKGNDIFDTRQTEGLALGYGLEIRTGVNDCNISNNNIERSDRDGILIRTTSSGHTIEGNHILNNGSGGIDATDCTDVIVGLNQIHGNAKAINMSGTSDEWIISNNNMKNNTSASTIIGAGTVQDNNKT